MLPFLCNRSPTRCGIPFTRAVASARGVFDGVSLSNPPASESNTDGCGSPVTRLQGVFAGTAAGMAVQVAVPDLNGLRAGSRR